MSATATTPASTANRALDAVSDKHLEIILDLQKKLDAALPLGTQMTAGLKDKVTAIFTASRTAWESEMSAGYANVRDNPQPPAVEKHAKH